MNDPTASGKLNMSQCLCQHHPYKLSSGGKHLDCLLMCPTTNTSLPWKVMYILEDPTMTSFVCSGAWLLASMDAHGTTVMVWPKIWRSYTVNIVADGRV